MLITEQSLVETLDGRAGDHRRRCRQFIPHQAVFIPNQLLFSLRLVFSHPADRWRGEAGHPAAGVKGNTGAQTGALASGRVGHLDSLAAVLTDRASSGRAARRIGGRGRE
jgi:hypothetical protein